MSDKKYFIKYKIACVAGEPELSAGCPCVERGSITPEAAASGGSSPGYVFAGRKRYVKQVPPQTPTIFSRKPRYNHFSWRISDLVCVRFSPVLWRFLTALYGVGFDNRYVEKTGGVVLVCVSLYET